MSNSHDAIAWAIRVSKGEPMPARMVLIVGLAPRCNDNNGFLVWPSRKQIAEDCDMSVSSVKRWLAHLESVGLVEVYHATRDNGSTSSNRYNLPVRTTYHHPTKGPLDVDMRMGEGVRLDQGEGVRLNPRGVQSCEPGGGSPAEPCIEHSTEHIKLNQGEHTQSDDGELPLGLPPVPVKDPTPAEVAALIAEQWQGLVDNYGVQPLRGGALTQANAEKARDLAKDQAVLAETALDVWRGIFEQIEGSDWLRGMVPGSNGRPPFKLSMSWLLEKRNFEKVVGGRFNGSASTSGQNRGGPTGAVVGDFVQQLRARRDGGARPGNMRGSIGG